MIGEVVLFLEPEADARGIPVYYPLPALVVDFKPESGEVAIWAFGPNRIDYWTRIERCETPEPMKWISKEDWYAWKTEHVAPGITDSWSGSPVRYAQEDRVVRRESEVAARDKDR